MTRSRSLLKSLGFSVVLLAILFPFVGVFVYMLYVSLLSPRDFIAGDTGLFFTPTLENYQRVVAENDVLSFALNSVIIASASTLIAVVIGVPAAFAIVHKGLSKTGNFALVTRATPGIILLLPWFVVFTFLGLIDSYPALVIAHLVVNLPLVVWMMANFMRDFPGEIVEAGRVDGASYFAVLMKLVLPNLLGGILAVSILSFILSWNNFMFSVVLALNEVKTLPVAAFSYLSYGNIDWGAIMAVSVVMTIPVVIAAFAAQRHLLYGLSPRTEV